jgi:hypothetical protein
MAHIQISINNMPPTQKTAEQSLVFGADDTDKSFTIAADCRVHSIAVHHPVFSNPVTLTISIENADGRKIFISDPIANPDAAADELLAQLEQFVSIMVYAPLKRH